MSSLNETQLCRTDDFVKVLRPDKKICFGKIDQILDGGDIFYYMLFL